MVGMWGRGRRKGSFDNMIQKYFEKEEREKRFKEVRLGKRCPSGRESQG